MIPKYSVVFFTLIGLCHLANSQCSVNIRNDLPARDPVYLRFNGVYYTIWTPDGPSLTSNRGSNNFLTCSGSSNYLTINNQKSSAATCVSGTTFSVSGRLYTSANLACAISVTGDIQNTGAVCGNNRGTSLYIGFDTGIYGFVSYIQSCYNMAIASTIYTRHYIPGRAINYAVSQTSRPSFKVAGTPTFATPAVSYTQVAQFSRFTILLGSAAQAQKFLTSTSFLARGHLTPDADAVFRTLKSATYFYTNAAPQWQVVNAGNWLRVENAARAKAAALLENLLIFTGTHDILRLPHINGYEVPITLQYPDYIEVPKWFWKVIKSKVTNAAIAIVTFNNPFARSLLPRELLCTDICRSYGWFDVNYSDFTKGFTYCCSVDVLRRYIPAIPDDALANSILRF